MCAQTGSGQWVLSAAVALCRTASGPSPAEPDIRPKCLADRGVSARHSTKKQRVQRRGSSTFDLYEIGKGKNFKESEEDDVRFYREECVMPRTRNDFLDRKDDGDGNLYDNAFSGSFVVPSSNLGPLY